MSSSGGGAGAGKSSGLGADSGNLAFSNPSSGKIDQQRKILEELERQKKMLKHGGDASAAAAPAAKDAAVKMEPAANFATGGSDSPQILSSNQRAAMELASKSSFGYFIPQDSSFGNTILPVIPRLAKPEK